MPFDFPGRYILYNYLQICQCKHCSDINQFSNTPICHWRAGNNNAVGCVSLGLHNPDTQTTTKTTTTTNTIHNTQNNNKRLYGDYLWPSVCHLTHSSLCARERYRGACNGDMVLVKTYI